MGAHPKEKYPKYPEKNWKLDVVRRNKWGISILFNSEVLSLSLSPSDWNNTIHFIKIHADWTKNHCRLSKTNVALLQQKIIQNNTLKKYQIWKEGEDSIVFPSNLTFFHSIIPNYFFVATAQHWFWIADSGFWFNPRGFWWSGLDCFNQKQLATDYELWSER